MIGGDTSASAAAASAATSFCSSFSIMRGPALNFNSLFGKLKWSEQDAPIHTQP